jgi:cyclophilin family peptidyl-prolyl cis-trans isomerase
MRNVTVLIVTWFAIGGALLATGCNRGSDNTPEATPVSIPGTGGELGKSTTPAGSARGANLGPRNAGPSHPVVEIKTTLGAITVELYPENAPFTVDNFRKYLREGFYDGTIFHSAVKDYVVIGGGFTPDRREKQPRAPVDNEAAKNPLKNVRGTIAMVRKPNAPHSATSHFFINVADNPHLDYRGPSDEEYGYCVFGKVIDGQAIVERIAAAGTHDEKGTDKDFDRIPDKDIVIESVRQVQ